MPILKISELLAISRIQKIAHRNFGNFGGPSRGGQRARWRPMSRGGGGVMAQNGALIPLHAHTPCPIPPTPARHPVEAFSVASLSGQIVRRIKLLECPGGTPAPTPPCPHIPVWRPNFMPYVPGGGAAGRLTRTGVRGRSAIR